MWPPRETTNDTKMVSRHDRLRIVVGSLTCWARVTTNDTKTVLTKRPSLCVNHIITICHGVWMSTTGICKQCGSVALNYKYVTASPSKIVVYNRRWISDVESTFCCSGISLVSPLFSMSTNRAHVLILITPLMSFYQIGPKSTMTVIRPTSSPQPYPIGCLVSND